MNRKPVPPDPPRRVGHPDEHFPYKRDAVEQALAENAPAGPDGPDDDSRRVADFVSVPLIDATAAYVAAQEKHLTEPSADNAREYKATAENLRAARQFHRRNRVTDAGQPLMRINGEVR